jgi:pimeloyl-ACP methyl ester carboxylesterase
MLRTEWTSVGDLRALTWTPEHPVGGVVLVDGSGEGRCDDWGGWAERIAELGVVVLAHDRPGCGGSPGDFLSQTLEDRADESLAALGVLRMHPAVTGPVGFVGFSQGGWVGMVAAARHDPPVDFLACIAGPGVGPAAQDRYRIEVDLRAAGLPGDQIAEGLAWIDERAERLGRGEDPEAVLTAQKELAGRPWHEIATRWFDNPESLAYLARFLPFQPAAVLPRVTCPVLALHGGADTLVPAADSVTAYAAGLPRLTGLAVFPGADHGLFVADPEPGVDRTSQLAPGFLPMLGGFLRRVG